MFFILFPRLDSLEDIETVGKPLIYFWCKDHSPVLPLKKEKQSGVWRVRNVGKSVYGIIRVCVCLYTYMYRCVFTKQNKAFWSHLSIQWRMYYPTVGHCSFSTEGSNSKTSSTPTIFMVNGVDEKCKAISTTVWRNFQTRHSSPWRNAGFLCTVFCLFTRWGPEGNFLHAHVISCPLWLNNGHYTYYIQLYRALWLYT